jgi:thioesterase domain-containing protein/acyl carrier protein
LALLSAQFDQDIAHQQYPSDHVSRGCAWRAKANIGIFDVVVNYVRNDYGFDIGGEPITCKNVSSGFAVPWGFMALDYRRGDGLDLFLDYDQGLIGRAEMDEVTAHLRQLFVADLSQSHLTLRDLARCGAELGGVVRPRSSEAAAAARAMRGNEIDARSATGDAERAHTAAIMHVTAQLRALWESTLGHPPANEDEDFFAAGGDSLKAICFIAECSQAFGMELPLTMLFENPTMRILGAVIAQARRTNGTLTEPRLVTLRAGDASPPLILVHPVGGTVTCYRDLAASLPGEGPVYGLRVSGLYEGEELAPSLGRMAEDYLDLLAALDTRLFHLAGWSFGGAVAFEMARRARRREWLPQSVTLIDTPFRVDRGAMEDHAALASVLAAAVGLKSLASTVIPRNAEQVLEMVCDAHDGASRPELKNFLRRVLLVVENARRLRREHQFRAYDGDVTLIEASGGFAGEPLDCAAWRQLVSGRVRVIELAARHEAVVFAPFATDVGTILENAMTSESSQEAHHVRR